MYNPKDILTEDGYEDYMAHLRNIENGLFYLKNNADDLHIGATDADQDDSFWSIISAWEDLYPVLKKGDGEKDE